MNKKDKNVFKCDKSNIKNRNQPIMDRLSLLK